MLSYNYVSGPMNFNSDIGSLIQVHFAVRRKCLNSYFLLKQLNGMAPLSSYT